MGTALPRVLPRNDPGQVSGRTFSDVIVVLLIFQYTEWPQKVSHYQMIKNRIKSCYSLSMTLDLLSN